MGFIARPGRDKAPLGKNGRMITVKLDRPCALLVAIMQVTCKPVMQSRYDAAVSRAVSMIPDIVKAELADAIAMQVQSMRRRQRGP